MSSLYHAKLGGGYTQRREIIIDAADMSEYGESSFEVAALTEDGDELDMERCDTAEQAKAAFDALIQKYAEPLQRTIASADLQPGGRYTLVYHNEFGFPVAQKVTFWGYAMRTYAQHSDVVQLTVAYRGGKTQWLKLFIGYEPLLIFRGWQSCREVLCGMSSVRAVMRPCASANTNRFPTSTSRMRSTSSKTRWSFTGDADGSQSRSPYQIAKV